jgi:hypothetical protein
MRLVFTGVEDPMGFANKLNANFQTLFAAAGALGQLNEIITIQQVNTLPFSTIVPLKSFQELLMTARTISGPLTFVPAINGVNGASVCVELTADGVAAHVPRFLDFNRAENSREWVNMPGAVNKITFGFRTGMAFYSIG